MKFKFFLSSLILLSLLIGCADYKLSSNKKDLEKTYYSSKGFALIYDEDLYKEKIINKKINNSDIKVMHSTLKPNTPILITNPDNSRSVETKIHKRANYPKIFNVIISKKISNILDCVIYLASVLDGVDEEKNSSSRTISHFEIIVYLF